MHEDAARPLACRNPVAGDLDTAERPRDTRRRSERAVGEDLVDRTSRRIHDEGSVTRTSKSWLFCILLKGVGKRRQRDELAHTVGDTNLARVRGESGELPVGIDHPVA